MTGKEYLESKGLNDHDYSDSGMINHISELMEEYHKHEQMLVNKTDISHNVNGSAYRDELIKKTESMEEFAKQNYDHKEYYEGLINGMRNMRAHIKNLYRKHYR